MNTFQERSNALTGSACPKKAFMQATVVRGGHLVAHFQNRWLSRSSAVRWNVEEVDKHLMRKKTKSGIRK